MRNEAVGLTKAYQGKPWVWLRGDDGPPEGSLVWCSRVERRGKDKHLATVILLEGAEVTCNAPPDELLGVPDIEVWREHLCRRQWLVDGRRFYIIDFIEERKLLDLSEQDRGYPALARKARRAANRVDDIESSLALREAADEMWSGAHDWASRNTHARITGSDPGSWDEADRDTAWGDEWFLYGVAYQELVACEQDPAESKPLSHQAAGDLWEEGWSRVQLDC